MILVYVYKLIHIITNRRNNRVRRPIKNTTESLSINMKSGLFFTIDSTKKYQHNSPVLRLYRNKHNGMYSLIKIENNKLYRVVLYGTELCNIVVTAASSNDTCCGVIRWLGEINLQALCLHLLECNKRNLTISNTL